MMMITQPGGALMMIMQPGGAYHQPITFQQACLLPAASHEASPAGLGHQASVPSMTDGDRHAA